MGKTDPTPHSSNEFLMLVFLGVLQIGVPYSLFTVGIHSVSALDALLLSMVEPVLNPVWVFIGIGETPSVYALIGGSIILAIVGTRAWLAYRASKGSITLDV
jgi:drug/metabolite transporter, DME family